MRRSRIPWVSLFVIAQVLAAVSAHTHAAEARVEVAKEVSGAWRQPDGAWDGRTVLIFHGFADDMDGAGDLTKRLAETLSDSGIASLRINFRGEGDRNRTDVQSTFTSRMEDAEAAHDFALKQPGVKPDHVGAMGWSLGATTAVETGGRHPDWFRTLAVWSCPSGDQFAALVFTETGKKALRDGQASETVPGWKTITTHRAFYESFRNVDLDQSMAKYPGAFLSVRGSLDFLPPAEVHFLKIVPGHPAEAVIIGGASHIFDVFEPQKGHATRAVQTTVEWFSRTL